MPKHGRDSSHVAPIGERPRCRAMPQQVQVHVRDTRALGDLGESLGALVRMEIVEPAGFEYLGLPRVVARYDRRPPRRTSAQKRSATRARRALARRDAFEIFERLPIVE